MGLSFSSSTGAPPNDVLISYSCNQMQAHNFIWPHPTTGMTPETQQKLSEIVPKLSSEFSYSNVHQVPRLTKIVVNVGRDARLGLGLAEDVPAVGIGIMTDADGTCDVAGAEYADFRWLAP